MSGIVNSAGSKSGIINQTELDYEEGTWTPDYDTPGASLQGTVTSSIGKYIKIGKVVYLWFTITASAGGLYFDTERGYKNIIGQPFIPFCPTGFQPYSGTWVGNGAADGVGGITSHFSGSGGLYLNCAGSNPNSSGVGTLMGTITYRIE